MSISNPSLHVWMPESDPSYPSEYRRIALRKKNDAIDVVNNKYLVQSINLGIRDVEFIPFEKIENVEAPSLVYCLVFKNSKDICKKLYCSNDQKIIIRRSYMIYSIEVSKIQMTDIFYDDEYYLNRLINLYSFKPKEEYCFFNIETGINYNYFANGILVG